MLILDAIREYVEPIERNVHSGEVFHSKVHLEDQRRAFIQHVLRPLLPLRYGLTLGRAFSIDDTTTHDDSILIYDAVFAMPMGRLMPCETVYATCEVVPHLDGEHFARCLQNIGSLKRLHRTKATAHDVTPVHHLGVFGARYAQLSDDKLNPYLGYIFTAEAIDPRVLLQHLNNLIEENVIRPEHTPDAIVCFRDHWIITRLTRTGDAAVPRSSFAKFGLWHPDSHLMSLIYVLLNVSLSQIQLRNPDLLRPLGALTKYKERH